MCVCARVCVRARVWTYWTHLFAAREREKKMCQACSIPRTSWQPVGRQQGRSWRPRAHMFARVGACDHVCVWQRALCWIFFFMVCTSVWAGRSEGEQRRAGVWCDAMLRLRCRLGWSEPEHAVTVYRKAHTRAHALTHTHTHTYRGGEGERV